MKKRLFTVMVAAMALSSSLTAFAAPVTMKDGTVFDADYYAQHNPDVVAVYGTDSKALYSHYTSHGKAEGRKSHMTAADDASFDAAYYAQHNPDVVAAYGTDPDALYSHYTTHGKAEGRQGHMMAAANNVANNAAANNAAANNATANNAAFDAAYYAQQNPDVVAVYGTDSKALYSHYTTHGKAEGRKSHR